MPSLLFGLLALGSLLTRTPVFRVVVYASTLTESPENRAATQRALHDQQVNRAVRGATVAYGLVELISSAINYLVNLQLVVGKFGSDAFNAQVAQANAVMRLPGLALSCGGGGGGHLAHSDGAQAPLRQRRRYLLAGKFAQLPELREP